MLTRSDNKLDINVKISKEINLHVTDLPLSSSFLIGTQKVIYFSAFSPKNSNFPSNFSANSLIIKW